MHDGKITTLPVKLRTNDSRADTRNRLGYSKTMKGLNKGTNIANRFMDTVKLVNTELIQSSSKEI